MLTRPATIWRGYLAVGLALTAAFLSLPRGSQAQVVVHLALHVLLLAALVAGVRIHRPSRPAPWYVLIGGVGLHFAADAVWYPAQVGIGDPLPFPAFTDYLFLAGYVTIAAALAMLAAAQARRGGFGALLDALMVAAGVGTLSWVFLAEPSLRATGLTLGGKAVVLGYPLIDLLLLAAACWLVFTSRRATPALRLVWLFVLAQLVGDVSYSLGMANGSFVFGTPLVGLWTLSFAFLGATALHPSMRELGTPDAAAADVRQRAVRRAVAAIALGPAMLVVESVFGRAPHAGFIGAAVLLILPLAVFRVRGLTVAVEDHRLTQEQLRQSEERYRTLVEHLPAFTYVDVLDPRTAWGSRTVYASPQTERFTGVAAQALVEDPTAWDRLVHPDDLARERDLYARLLATGQSHASELRLIRPDGRILWVRHEAVLVSGGADGGVLVQGILFDITESREAEQRLQEAEERWRLLLEHLPVIPYVIEYEVGEGAEEEVREAWIGPGIEQLIGITQDEWIADDDAWQHITHPDDWDWVRRAWEASAEAGQTFEAEYRIVRRDGGVVWIRDQATATLRKGWMRAEGVFIDVTASREAQQAVRESEARFRALMEDAPDAVLAVDAQGVILVANRRAEQVFGFESHQLVGRPVDDLVPEHLRGAHAGHRADFGADPSIRPMGAGLELLGRRKDGSTFPVEISLGFVPNEGGEPIVVAFVRDVTLRKRAEAALVEAETRCRTLVERIPAIVYVSEFGEPAPWLFVSPQAGSILGYEPEEWIADEALWMRLIHPEDLERVLTVERQSRASGERFECEYRMIARDGRDVWIRDEAEVVFDDTGVPALLRGIMYDVTERRLAEDALRRHGRILEAVTAAGEALLSGRWEDHISEVLSALGRAAEVSRVFFLTGHTAPDGELLLSYRSEWCAQGIASQVGNPDLYDIPIRQAPYSRWGDILTAGGIVHGPVEQFPPHEREALEQQGVRSLAAVPLLVAGELWGEMGFDECARDRVWDHQELEALKAAAGVLSAAVGRQRSEDAVRVSEERFRLLSDAAVEGVIVDVEGTIVEANRAFCRMMGMDLEALVGSSPKDALAPESLPVVFEYLASGSEAPVDLDIHRKDGTRLVVEGTLRRIEHDGRPASLLTLHDITARKEAEESLARMNEELDQRVRDRTQDLEAANVDLTVAKDAAEAANRAKSEFLSRASHELRTPLNAILGFGQLLETASLPEDDRESVGMIMTAGRRLLDLVDEVLDIARIDSGRVSIASLPVPLDQALDQALGLVAAGARAAGVELHRDVPEKVPVVLGDAHRLTHAFAHLLTDAIERCRDGDRISIWCECDDGPVRIHVSDTGPGIPEEQLRGVFVLFGPLDRPDHGARGPGVGLPLAKAWIEAMGGTLSVVSQVGVGTTFTVELAAVEEPVR